MKKKFLGRVLTMLLVASMVFTLLPAPAIAAGNWWWNNDEYTEEAVPTATADENYHYNIFFLDCGRKYYSVDSIKQLIDNASAAGFNYIQLAVGNDGLRFLLDDMSLTVNGTTYSSQQVSTAIHAGNEAYYNFETDELTQSEMDTIIAYAKDMGMGVIPCVNTPGHMDAILSAATSLTKTNCSYSGSKRTIDVTNATAVAFTQALLQKYINYFADKGCQLFNMGADEYANDIYTGGAMGFGNLQDSGNYRYYVTYVNAVAAMIKDAGMTPMAFNDGIYFNSNTSSGTFDTDIIICYWSNGWSSYSPMPAATLASKGFKLVNTNGDYYWVLGKTDAQCSASKASGFNYKSFPGSTIDAPAGSMFCIWADYPGAETEADVVSKTADTIKAFGGALPVLTPSQPDTGITITPSKPSTGGASNTVTMGEQMTLTANEKVYWSWNSEVVELTSADSDEAASTVALYAEQSLYAQSVNVKPLKAGDAGITVAADETGTPQPYSLTVVNSAASTGVTVDLKVGQTSDTYTVDGNVTDTDMKLASNFKDVASYTLKHRTETPVTVNTISSPVGEEVYIKDETGKKYLDNTATWTEDVDKAAKWYCRQTEPSNWWESPYIYLKLVENSSKPYLKHLGSGRWGVAQSSGDRAELAFNNTSKKFTVTEGWLNPTTYTLGTPVQISPGSSTAYTDITFTGVAEGTTHVTIGGTKYTINVSYYEQPVNVVLNQSKTVEVSGTLNTDGLNTDVATVSADGTTMTVTGVAEGNTSVIVGNTKYLIKVNKENLEAVTPLKIEYWITNGRAQHSETNTAQELTVKATADGMTTENGVAVTAADMVPNSAFRGGRNVDYWQCRLLDKDADGWQTDVNGIDQTTSGVAFTKVRYYESHWAVYTEKNKWVNIESNHQLVAYFLEHIQVTDEVDSHAADWGKKGDGTPHNEYLDPNNVNTLSFQVVYEDGNTNPSGTTAEDLASKTICYGYWTDGRGIGTVMLDETLGYEIYKVTAETGALTGSGSTWEGYTVKSFTWDKNEITVWEGESNGRVILHNNALVPEREGKYANLMWDENKESILLRIYVRAKATLDSLYVHYIDMTDKDNEFYSYPINVKQGTTFSPEFNLSSEKNVLVGNEVLNSANVNQKVTAELKNMTEIGAQYRYADYECKRVDKDAALKNVYLYYTFSRKATFVADFGLPIEIPLEQINDNLKTATITKVEVQGTAFGNATVSNDMKSITYTPSKVFGTETESFSVNVTGNIVVDGTAQTGTVGYRVYILPASNVLYEENFLTAANDSGWKKAGNTPTTEQETQKVNGGGSYNVFGYDNAYVKNGEQNVTGQLGVWQASGLQYSTSTGVMTTEFYGNGFDLIGSCGKNTGRILLGIFKGNEKRPVATRIIDTKFDDANVAEMLYQVPLAHVMLKDEAQYRVEIYASGVKEQTNNARANSRSVSAAAYSYDDYADGFASILDSYGVRMSDVECISFADIADSASAAATMSLRPVALAVEGAAGSCSVEIDSFRVYRSANDTNYPENEKNVTYTNVLDAFKNGGFTAFTENGGGKWTTRGDYESNGGPQNEIYLRSSDGTAGDAVAFSVGANQTVQISARAVESNGKTAKMVVNGGIPVGISSNTEMYYVVTAGDDGIITIKNIGEAMLALGNLKVKSTQTVAELSDEQIPMAIALLSMAPAPEEPEQPAAFTPEHFDAKVSATRLGRNKIVRLTVTTSSDVAKLTVNGKELRPVNGWLVKMGWSSSYTYILSEKMPRNGSKPFEIICYNADGVASAARVVTGQ